MFPIVRTILLVAVFYATAFARAVDALDAYPTASEIKVGEAYGRIAPRFRQSLELPVGAPVTVKFRGVRATLKEGEVWGEVDPGRLALEREKLENARRTLELKTRNPEAEFKRIEGERRLNEIEIAVSTISGRDPALLRKMDLGEDATKDYERRMKLALDALERERGLLRRKLDDLDAERRAEIRTAEIALRLQEHDFERVSAAAVLTMPVSGVISILYPESKDGVYRPVSGTPFAVIEDASSFRAAVPLAVAGEWRDAPPESLIVRAPTDGGFIRAEGGERIMEKLNGRDESLLAFTFAGKDAGAASALSGANVRMEVYRKTAKPFRLVPKMALIRNHPELFETGAEWAFVVARCWPGARLSVVGSHELGVEPPDATGGATPEIRREGDPAKPPRGFFKRKKD